MAPDLMEWSRRPTALSTWEAPLPLRVILPLMAAGVLLSGLRDMGAAPGPRWLRFPWARS